MGRALITGASAGLGLAFARQLASDGHDVVLVARNQERLDDVGGQIRETYGVEVEVIAADLGDVADTQRVAQRLSARDEPISLLVNNAGFGLGQDFVGGSIARELDGLNVMVRAVMMLSHAAAEAMVVRGRGTIINVASMTSLTVQGTYSAHKAWVRTFSEGLAVELAGTGVGVTVVNPGLIRTEFHERSHVDSSQWPAAVFASPEQVVRAALVAARAGRVEVTPTVLYKLASVVVRHAPRRLVRKFAGPGLSGRGR
ncbi:SDR family NAD(P)-dependent oxidoreductase [Arcanobacterium phocae]|uniref:SDR family NAD(P)-dependent oxidoreductase n=1 Tax=Arcanobacterium phocae TaxID=131112 RepID=UPI001C0F0FA5|nr:SDR family NAD(P)-dependent oxidoreductase [Arcanobacterium phocae]